jgi:maltose O-acetyltransferase
VGWLASKALDLLEAVESRVARWRADRHWKHLQQLGMRVGRGVVLPASTWIDAAHCYLVDIGDDVRFGPQCLILAHDAQMDEFLDAGRLGRVSIGPGCQIGARTVILCNVEIGAHSIVEAGSVVSVSLPADSYCAGSPARVVCSRQDYVQRLERESSGRPSFTPAQLSELTRTAAGRKALREQLAGRAALVRALPAERPASESPR